MFERTPKFATEAEKVEYIKSKMGIEILNAMGILNILLFPFLSVISFTAETTAEALPIVRTIGWFFFFGGILWATVYFLTTKRVFSSSWKGPGTIVIAVWLAAGVYALVHAFNNKTMIFTDQTFLIGSIAFTAIAMGVSSLLVKRAHPNEKT